MIAGLRAHGATPEDTALEAKLVEARFLTASSHNWLWTGTSVALWGLALTEALRGRYIVFGALVVAAIVVARGLSIRGSAASLKQEVEAIRSQQIDRTRGALSPVDDQLGSLSAPEKNRSTPEEVER